MSTESTNDTKTEVVEEVSYLDRALQATTEHTSDDQTRGLLKALTDSATKGTVSWDRNLTKTIYKAIEEIDKIISKQLAAVLHDDKFQKLEGSWRGMRKMVFSVSTGSDTRLALMNITKRELSKDLVKSGVEKSMLYKRVYDQQYGTAGGSPFATLIGDFEFENSADDIDLLRDLSQISANSFCPLISAASPQLLGLTQFPDIKNVNDLQNVFDSSKYASWKGFRESEESRFVCLTMPRVVARAPYGEGGKTIEKFNFQELEINEEGQTLTEEHDDYCWSNAAYSMGSILNEAFEKYGWCTNIRGFEGGGRVLDLPVHSYTNRRGETKMKTPTEIEIHDGEEKVLSELGFMPLVHYKETDYAYFPGAQTCQKAKLYDDNAANDNAKLGTRLPYIMATARIAHYLKVMARDKVGSSMEAKDMQAWLTRWIEQYTNSNEDASAEMKAQYPLREAKIEVTEIPGQPGAYNAVAWLRPWLQMEELNAALRLVANIPSGKS